MFIGKKIPMDNIINYNKKLVVARAPDALPSGFGTESNVITYGKIIYGTFQTA